MTTGLIPGFTDAVDSAQRCFRQILTAMSRPGTLVTIVEDMHHPIQLSRGMAGTALTLLDLDTPVWLAPELKGVGSWLTFHTGAPITPDPAAATFAFAVTAAKLPPLDAFDLGSAEYPDRSTTLVVEVPTLEAGGGLSLCGPGIDGTTHLAIGGPGGGFWAGRARLAALFPRGLDLILTCGDVVAALPRTTRIVEA